MSIDTYEVSSDIKDSSEIDKRTEKRKIGDKGEEIASRYLIKQGYHVLERNFLCRLGELDIVAYYPKDRVLVFVEVKTRNTTDYGFPGEFVNSRKQRCLKRTAEYYRICNKQFSSLYSRMDIVEVLILDGGTYVKHIKNAF